MTPDAQRIAIAELCGWRSIIAAPGFATDARFPRGLRGCLSIHAELPDYLGDLNAIHEAEDIAFPRGQVTERGHRYYEELAKLSNLAWVATAAQRAEAFLRALNKWTDA